MLRPSFRVAVVLVAALLAGASGVVLAEDAAPAATAAEPAAGPADQAPAVELAGTSAPNIAKGKRVWQVTADCVNCHGWPGDGATGRNPRSPGIAANLRITQLDTNTMIQVVSCGIPGSAMPYHDRRAYKDARCYGQKASDFQPGQLPNPGNFVSNQDIINVVAYVQKEIRGRGPITKAECEAYFKPGAAACKDYP
jgi:hypothetical protein